MEINHEENISKWDYFDLSADVEKNFLGKALEKLLKDQAMARANFI